MQQRCSRFRSFPCRLDESLSTRRGEAYAAILPMMPGLPSLWGSEHEGLNRERKSGERGEAVGV